MTKAETAAVKNVVESYEQFAGGLRMLIDQVAREPGIAVTYQPLMPVLKRLQPLIAQTIAALEQDG